MKNIHTFQLLKSELIETLWNVNLFPYSADDKNSHELIETLWNVNEVQALAIKFLAGINRNIVECKYLMKAIQQ